MEPLGDVQLKEAKAGAINWIQQLQMKTEDIFIKKGISLAIIGFLLGRALILSQLAPFGLPFFAAVFLMRRDRAPLALFGLIAGGLTVHYSNSLVIFASAFLLLFFIRSRSPPLKDNSRRCRCMSLLHYSWSTWPSNIWYFERFSYTT